jgi:CDP-4-dehydro-6-deoxyglucose reductase
MTVMRQPLPPWTMPGGPLPATTRARPIAAPNATLAGRTEVTATLATFVVVTDSPVSGFKPGQYVSLGVYSGTELIQRPYSIVSLSDDRLRLEFLIRRLPDGRLSNLLWPLPAGDRVHVGPVKGLFTLDADDHRPRVMVATGSGLAPMLAMLESAFTNHDKTPSVLIHGVSFHAELAYQRQIAAWSAAGLPLDYRPTVSRPREVRNAGWVGPVGRAETQLEALLHEWRWLRAGGSVAYLCGNPEMTRACAEVLGAAGFAPADIRVELFHAA